MSRDVWMVTLQDDHTNDEYFLFVSKDEASAKFDALVTMKQEEYGDNEDDCDREWIGDPREKVCQGPDRWVVYLTLQHLYEPGEIARVGEIGEGG